MGQWTSEGTWTATAGPCWLQAAAQAQDRAQDRALPGCLADGWTSVMAVGPMPLAASPVTLS